MKGQVSFDYLLTLSVVGLVFMAALGIIITQGDLLVSSLSTDSKELLCERISWALVRTYEGGGLVCISSDYPLSFNGTLLLIDEDYTCLLPRNVSDGALPPGEVCIKNGRLLG